MRQVQKQSHSRGYIEPYKGQLRLQRDVDNILHQHMHVFLQDMGYPMGNQEVDIDVDVVLSSDQEFMPPQHALGLAQTSSQTNQVNYGEESDDFDNHNHELDVRIYEGAKIGRPLFFRTRSIFRRIFTERLRS